MASKQQGPDPCINESKHGGAAAGKGAGNRSMQRRGVPEPALPDFACGGQFKVRGCGLRWWARCCQKSRRERTMALITPCTLHAGPLPRRCCRC